MGLTANQTALVKSTAPVLRQHGNTITSLFYANMLRENPSLRNIFNLSHQRTGDQPRALANAVLAYAEHIDDLGALGPAVEHIAHKHVSLGVTPEQYDIVGEYLVKAFVEVLGDALTPELADAWTAAYQQLADVFIKREGEMYDEAGDRRGWRKFKIDRREPESETVTSFYLKPADEGVDVLPGFLPGQYVSLRVKVPQLDGVYQCRQYSLSEGPAKDHYRISVKREHATEEDAQAGITPGVVSNLLYDNYQAGDEVEVSFPRGDFTVDVKDAALAEVPLVLLSAGVGVTPMKSILDTVLFASETKMGSRPIRWIQTARNSKEMPIAKTVRDIAKEKNNVGVKVFLKEVKDGDEKGREYDFEGKFDLKRLEKESDLGLRDPKTQYLICGPPEWMVSVKRSLAEMGVTGDTIKMELFGTGTVDGA